MWLYSFFLFIVQLSFKSYSQPTISGPSSLCQNSSATLAVVESFTSYEWNTGATTQSIIVTTQGTYTVTVTDQGNNMSSASHILIVNPLPQVQILGGNALCEGSTKTLTASIGFSEYLWNTGETTASIDINTPGNYSVTVTDNNNCSGDASIVITQVSNPNPIIQGPGTICPGTSNLLDAGSWSTYQWNDGRNTQQLSINSAGTYTVTITDQNGCEGVANKMVQEYEVSTISISGNTEICDGDNTTLMVNPSSGMILWNTGSTNSSILVNMTGIYDVTVTDVNMCQVTESVNVTNPVPSLSCPEDIFITVHEPTLDTSVHFNIDILNACGNNLPIVQTDTSGFQSGDSFPLGTTSLSFLLDVEGNQQGGCSFNVNVVQKSQKVIKMENGDLFLKGIYKGAIYQSPDGSCWKIVVTNKGEIRALKIECPE